ncbi:hypothetical protein DIE14_31490 [Burkholderia sp. Bp9017]|nr:hypothetical protein DIE14_31490 [Burkholderia sp. Bp9017]RQZ28098.1 hypothetical protein DIE13_28215 [Burkholderia sp. Bp9016]
MRPLHVQRATTDAGEVLRRSAGYRTMPKRRANVLLGIVHPRLSPESAARDHRRMRQPARAGHDAAGPAIMLTTWATIQWTNK